MFDLKDFPDESIILEHPLGIEGNAIMLAMHVAAKEAGIMESSFNLHELIDIKNWIVDQEWCPYNGDTVLLVLALWVGRYQGAVNDMDFDAHRKA